MPQSKALVAELKKTLRDRGLTYAAVARRIGRSEATVKRWFSQETFTLAQLDALCTAAGVELTDLLEQMRQSRPLLTQLHENQEEELLRDPKLFLLTWLLINRWTYEGVLEAYDFTEREIQRLLVRLDRLRLIELRTGNRWRLLATRNFSWQRGGPMQRFLTQSLFREFFDSKFDDPHAELRFFAAPLSEASLVWFRRTLLNLMRDATELAAQDAALPMDQRISCAAVLAIRPWHYSGFGRFRRESQGAKNTAVTRAGPRESARK